MTLPYRFIEILQALAEHPEGCTTKQVFDYCQALGGSELPDTKITSQCLYSLKRSKNPLVITRDAIGGNVHKITAAGRESLKKELASGAVFMPSPKPIEKTETETAASSEQKTESQDQPTPIDAKDQEAEHSSDIRADTIKTFDHAVAIIRDCLTYALYNPKPDPVCINDKARKLATLESLAAMPIFTQDLADILTAIKGDLEQLNT